MYFHCAMGVDKKLACGRCFWRLIVACLMVMPVASLAQGPEYTPARVLTEAEAVRLGLSRSDVNAFLAGEIGIAQSEVMTAKRWPNPEFSYTREPGSSLPNDPNQ